MIEPLYQQQAEQAAADCGTSRLRWIDPADIPVNAAFRASCAMNQCGEFGRRWSCPPALAAVEVLRERIQSYSGALVFQADYSFADDFDYEGMEKGALDFYRLCRCVESSLRGLGLDALVLGAGSCRECRQCTYPKRPCVRPQGPVYSLEAFGVDVNALCRLADLPYVLDGGIVPYTAMALIRLAADPLSAPAASAGTAESPDHPVPES